MAGGDNGHRVAKRTRRPEVKPGDFEMVLIAASAGGVPALQDFLARLPTDFPVPIAAAPATTAYSTMPLSAIGTGAVDRVLPLDRIPAELTKLVAPLAHTKSG